MDWWLLCIHLPQNSRFVPNMSARHLNTLNPTSSSSRIVGCFVERVCGLVGTVYQLSLGQSADLQRGCMDWQVVFPPSLRQSAALQRGCMDWQVVFPPSLRQSAALQRGHVDWQVLCSHLLQDSRLLCREGIRIGRYCVSTFSGTVGCFVERHGLVGIVYSHILWDSQLTVTLTDL